MTGFGAVVEQSMKRFQRAFSVVGEQMVPEFEIDNSRVRPINSSTNSMSTHRRRAPPNQFTSSLASVCTSVPTRLMISPDLIVDHRF